MAVYFIRAGEFGPVKIGTAVTPQRRLRYFQTGHYETLNIIRTVHGGIAEESWLHHHYAKLRIRNEWFKFCPSMMEIEPPVFAVVPPKASFPIINELEDRAAAAGLSLAALCRRAEIAPITFRRWRAGTSDPGSRRLARVEEIVLAAERRAQDGRAA